MSIPRYALVRELPELHFEEAAAKITETLKGEGFGVLTTIDVKATLKKKLDQDFRPYIILGACNPPLAHEALSAEEHLGLLLPCNVVVQERAEGGSTVSMLRPTTLFGLVDREGLDTLAHRVEDALQRALDAV